MATSNLAFAILITLPPRVMEGHGMVPGRTLVPLLKQKDCPLPYLLEDVGGSVVHETREVLKTLGMSISWPRPPSVSGRRAS